MQPDRTLERMQKVIGYYGRGSLNASELLMDVTHLLAAGDRLDLAEPLVRLWPHSALADLQHWTDEVLQPGYRFEPFFLGRASREVLEKHAQTMQPRIVQLAARVADLLPCMVSPRFHRPVPLDLAWLTPAVVGIAQRIYEEGDFAALPVLADALEEAGCTDADILTHCRWGGEHVRGCWVVDALLGKG
jgi:hypothetical protein